MKKIKPEQIVLGFVKYINQEVIPSVDDTFTKLALKTFAISTEVKMPVYLKSMESMLESQFATDFLDIDDEGIEVEFFIDTVRKAINECGELTIKIPPVKFISPEEKVLSFGAQDITKLKQYLTNEIK